MRRLEVDVKQERPFKRGWWALDGEIKILTEALTKAVHAGLRPAAVDIDSTFQRGMASGGGNEYKFAEGLHDWIDTKISPAPS